VSRRPKMKMEFLINRRKIKTYEFEKLTTHKITGDKSFYLKVSLYRNTIVIVDAPHTPELCYGLVRGDKLIIKIL
jgi:hypothetical protein